MNSASTTGVTGAGAGGGTRAPRDTSTPSPTAAKATVWRPRDRVVGDLDRLPVGGLRRPRPLGDAAAARRAGVPDHATAQAIGHGLVDPHHVVETIDPTGPAARVIPAALGLAQRRRKRLHGADRSHTRPLSLAEATRHVGSVSAMAEHAARSDRAVPGHLVQGLRAPGRPRGDGGAEVRCRCSTRSCASWWSAATSARCARSSWATRSRSPSASSRAVGLPPGRLHGSSTCPSDYDLYVSSLAARGTRWRSARRSR